MLANEPWATPEVLDQIFAAKALIGRARAHALLRRRGRRRDRQLLRPLPGRRPTRRSRTWAPCPSSRGRGYAKAVVLGAIAEARRAGAEFVCLVADANDWPKELYRRLGFDELGHYTKFFAPRREVSGRALRTRAREALRLDDGARRRRPRGRRGRARRPARPERRRQVDARQDRVRARPADARAAPRSAARAPARSRRAGGSATSPSCSASPAGTQRDELLALHQRLAGSTGGEAERDELLELVGLADARDRRVEEMSKGMQQRLGIAQALVGAPPLLLLDEPTSALDPVGRRTVRELLEELRARGISVLLNSHLLSEVELVCDRVVILLRGEVVAEGAPAELAPAARGRDRDRRGRAALRRRGREDAPRLVAELVAARPPGLRRPRARPRRSRTSTSRPSAERPRELDSDRSSATPCARRCGARSSRSCCS